MNKKDVFIRFEIYFICHLKLKITVSSVYLAVFLLVAFYLNPIHPSNYRLLKISYYIFI